MNYKLISRILFYSFIFFPLFLFAQKNDTISFSGVVIVNSGALPDKKVKLNPYNEEFRKFETDIKPDGSFQFKVPLTDVAFYEVVYGGYSKGILFTKEESNPGFRIVVTNGKPDQMFITNSFENVAHENLRSYIVAFRDTLKGFRESCISSSTNCVKYWSGIIADFNMHVQQLINDYPKTLTGRVLAPISLSPEISNQSSPVIQMEKHFFDGVNFSDVSVFSTADIATKFTCYLNNLADTSKSGRYNFINDIFMRAMGNENANKKVGLALYNIFSKTNRENYLQSMFEWLQTRPWADEQLPIIMARLRMASKVTPGSKADEILAQDSKGDQKKLNDLTKTGTLTMVLFWSSDCSHCIESLPEFKSIYERYHSRGLNIYAASLDADLMQWKKFVSENNMAWTNVFLGSSNPALESYSVQATPTAVLVDNKGLIVERFMEVPDLKNYLEKNIK